MIRAVHVEKLSPVDLRNSSLCRSTALCSSSLYYRQWTINRYFLTGFCSQQVRRCPPCDDVALASSKSATPGSTSSRCGSALFAGNFAGILVFHMYLHVFAGFITSARLSARVSTLSDTVNQQID